MGTDANEMVKIAVESAMNGDLDAAARVISMDDRIDEFDRNTLNKTVVVVMQESPVAADLRFLIATIGIVGEIEKVGDDAVKLARRARKISGKFPKELRIALVELSELSRGSFAGALRLFCAYRSDLAQSIISGDEDIDNAYVVARNRVFELIKRNPDDTENLVRCIEVFHALEHVADHAVAIAVRMSMLYEPPSALD